MCNRRRPAATSSQSIISALASANSFVYFASSAATSTLTHLHVSNCRVRQLPVLWHFALGFVGNGVITVMINSPWQADDDADNQSGDNRGDSAHTSISLTVPYFFEFCNQAVSAFSGRSHNQRPAVKPRYCCNGRLLTDIHHDQSPLSATLLNLLQCHSVLTFRREVFQAKLLAVGIHNGKEAGSVRRLLIWVLGLAWQVCGEWSE